MCPRDRNSNTRLRRQLALEAARLITEHGIRDYRLAKQKALQRYGSRSHQALPRNVEIEAAMLEYQHVFHAAQYPRLLADLRTTACQAMRFLAPFHPCLVGSVLSGAVNEHSDINLHVFAGTPEDISNHLRENGIRYDLKERALKYIAGTVKRAPAYRYADNDTIIDLTVLALRSLHHAPLSPVDGHPMKRASLQQLATLMQADNDM